VTIVILIIYSFLFLGTFRALLVFNKCNIIIFLEKFKLIYDNIRIKTKIKTKRILKYCEDNIVKKLKGFKK